MALKITKASLLADLEAVKKAHTDDMARRDDEIRELKSRAHKLESDVRLTKQDADRHERNWNDCEKRLVAIRQVIGTTLEVRHQTGVNETQEWFRGQPVKEDVPEDVRLLRHLYHLSNNQPPF